ncbi:hypothetical protein A2Z22_01225 [Candidatus Woesebacteria bacterium RBG_16_34_12]|uniref:Peptidase E n=1 Tax=Candidatus Woesebacteria bacterium RBG_16_34_12 TaxID=1802480 RepID=A0A1F7X8P0_9BACT|nr:MAG: hypothetical protein A2Z22_01225 [Candidatus Woesebacteria bacterium RBG_16_34_12]
MKKLYLASSIDQTAKSIAKDIGKDPKKLKLAFIITASEVEKGELDWLDDDRNGLIEAGFDLFDYTITGKTRKDIERDLGNVDVVHVNGGNSFYLMLQIRKCGFDEWIKSKVNTGVIYSGSSAGSIVAAPNIEIAKKIATAEYEKKLKSYKGIGLVDFIILPHWGSEYFKDLYLKKRLEIAYKPENKIILLNDYQYVKVEDDSYKIVDVRDK